MRAQDRRRAPIQIPAHGDFFAGGLGVKIHHDDLGLDTGEKVIGKAERIVGRRHEDAPLQADHRVMHAALGHAFEDAVARQPRLQICRPQHPPGPVLVSGAAEFK